MTRGVRFRDGEFELRCEGCARRRSATAYWPLTLEFWNPTFGMVNCRACLAVWARERMRGRYARNAEARAAKLAQARANHAALLSDAVAHEAFLAKRREYQQGYRERQRSLFLAQPGHADVTETAASEAAA